jgi:hypothetical protein
LICFLRLNVSNSIGNVLEFEVTVNLENVDQLANPESQNYKYFIAQKTTIAKDKLFLKKIEYTWRTLNIGHNNINNALLEISDKWPLLDSDGKPSRIDYGWLLNGENEFQFHFSNNPIQCWLPTTEEKYLWLEIVPWRANNGLYELKDYVLTHVVIK